MKLTTKQIILSALGPREELLGSILRKSLSENDLPPIQIDDNAGRLLQLLVKLKKPKLILEIGTLFGYSAIYLARGLDDDSRLISLELDEKNAKIARENIKHANLSDKIEVIQGDAIEFLKTMSPESVGIIFIDADKKSYPNYLKHCFPLLEIGGLLIADDAFAMGDYSVESKDVETKEATDGILTYIRAAGQSQRLFSTFIENENGLMISMKTR